MPDRVLLTRPGARGEVLARPEGREDIAVGHAMRARLLDEMQQVADQRTVPGADHFQLDGLGVPDIYAFFSLADPLPVTVE